MAYQPPNDEQKTEKKTQKQLSVQLVVWSSYTLPIVRTIIAGIIFLITISIKVIAINNFYKLRNYTKH